MASDTDNLLVKLEDVRFAYGEREILRGIDLTIRRGQVVAIMGGSGCGKTTLLRLIGGQLRASKGAVVVDGQDLGRLSHNELYALRRRMGMLFQFGALFTDLSATWPKFDGFVHAIGYAPREAIAGDVADKTITLRTDKLVTMEEAAFVISAVAEQGGTIVILTKKGSN